MDNTVSSEYQRREKENIILEKKEMNLELLDYNFQVEVINSSIKKFLDNFPKSLPSKYSNIVVFPKKEKRIAWEICRYYKGADKYASRIIVYLTEKGELVIEAPIDEERAVKDRDGKDKDGETENVAVMKCFFLKLVTVEKSFNEVSSGIQYLKDEVFFKDIARELVKFFCNEKSFSGLFNILPIMDYDRYCNSKPSVKITRGEHLKEKTTGYLSLALKVAMATLCVLAIIMILIKIS